MMASRERRIGKYVLKRPVGGGGMGTVYLALDTETGNQVALKVPNAGVSTCDALRRQFFLEGRALASVRHPNIVVALAVSENSNPPFIAMEYIPGRTLAEELKARGYFDFQATKAINIGRASCR